MVPCLLELWCAHGPTETVHIRVRNQSPLMSPASVGYFLEGVGKREVRCFVCLFVWVGGFVLFCLAEGKVLTSTYPKTEPPALDKEYLDLQTNPPSLAYLTS